MDKSMSHCDMMTLCGTKASQSAFQQTRAFNMPETHFLLVTQHHLITRKFDIEARKSLMAGTHHFPQVIAIKNLGSNWHWDCFRKQSLEFISKCILSISEHFPQETIHLDLSSPGYPCLLAAERVPKPWRTNSTWAVWRDTSNSWTPQRPRSPQVNGGPAGGVGTQQPIKTRLKGGFHKWRYPERVGV